MYLAVRILFAPSEAGREYDLRVAFSDPDGHPFQPPRTLRIAPQPDTRLPERDIPFQFVYHLRDIQFRAWGRHVASVFVDQDQIASASVWIREAELAPSSRDPVFGALAAGFEAFRAGDMDAAVAAFQWATTTDPRNARAFNNLGFTRLALGDAQEALVAFNEAERLGGFGEQWLAAANIASCRYLLGDHDEALAGFEAAARLSVTVGDSVLFAIGRDSLRPFYFSLPVEFIGLMALNAAWSAHRLGDRDEALRLARLADIEDLGASRTAESVSAFQQGLIELRDELGAVRKPMIGTKTTTRKRRSDEQQES